MTLDLLLSLAAFAVTLFFVLVGWRQRRRARRAWPGGVRPANSFQSSYALGNALQVLQQISQPGVRHVLVEQNDEDVDAEENGAPPDPARVFRQQMARVRRGERIGPLRLPLG